MILELKELTMEILPIDQSQTTYFACHAPHDTDWHQASAPQGGRTHA